MKMVEAMKIMNPGNGYRVYFRSLDGKEDMFPDLEETPLTTYAQAKQLANQFREVTNEYTNIEVRWVVR